METPSHLRYSTDHEWVLAEDGRARVGITDFAQDALGDVVYVELPDVGTKVSAGESFGEIESTKSVSDIFAPISGEVVEINDDLEEQPELVNTEPYGGGWICLIVPESASSVDELLDAEGYLAHLSE